MFKVVLVKTMGEAAVPLNKAPHIPTVIKLAGCQGAGKTTTVGKLSKYCMEKVKARPCLIAAVVTRPAAMYQCQTMCKQLNVPVL